jgi:hypothetical protein
LLFNQDHEFARKRRARRNSATWFKPGTRLRELRLHACTPDRGARRGHGGGWAAAGGAIGTATIRAFGRIWKALLDVVRLSTSLE